MTEDEAKTKWCPFVRYEGDYGGPFNRGGEKDNPLNIRARGDYSCSCIGSACMAWREESKNTGTSYRPEWTKNGYCGLAGKP